MGKPKRSLTFNSISIPFSKPGPRYEWIEVRLALSNDDLKITGTLYFCPASATFSATVYKSSWFSITHGPRIKNGFCLICSKSISKYITYKYEYFYGKSESPLV